ncbi:hypothetical protein F5050DRAFT_1809542 [Lentinula boryana]|uniref:Uncharacterized protein n=1 Tax=Lentinula boryana TaxID=40481 RepID=A0ABQ8Q7G9_9AGAR|nr:hypothetical protein F5050DRAFT_1809542 [Lentinula boryana]
MSPLFELTESKSSSPTGPILPLHRFGETQENMSVLGNECFTHCKTMDKNTNNGDYKPPELGFQNDLQLSFGPNIQLSCWETGSDSCFANSSDYEQSAQQPTYSSGSSTSSVPHHVQEHYDPWDPGFRNVLCLSCWQIGSDSCFPNFGYHRQQSNQQYTYLSESSTSGVLHDANTEYYNLLHPEFRIALQLPELSRGRTGSDSFFPDLGLDQHYIQENTYHSGSSISGVLRDAMVIPGYGYVQNSDDGTSSEIIAPNPVRPLQKHLRKLEEMAEKLVGE